jgi:hypothetical protein
LLKTVILNTEGVVVVIVIVVVVVVVVVVAAAAASSNSASSLHLFPFYVVTTDSMPVIDSIDANK